MSVLRFPAALPSRPVDRLLTSPMLYWASGGVLLFLLQALLTGTDPVYALLTVGFVLVSGATITCLGGIITLPGLCVTWLVFQHVLLSQIAKVMLGQPADDVLLQPLTTMGVYLVGMTGLLLAARIARQLHVFSVRPLFRTQENPASLFALALIATVFAAARLWIVTALGTADDGTPVVGGLLGPLKTMELLTSFSIAAGTAHAITATGGRRSLTALNATAMLIPSLFGLLQAGRAAIMMAFVVYVATCAAYGYRFRPKHYLFLGLSGLFAYFVLFPYALYARRVVRTPDLATNVRVASDLLTDVVFNAAEYRKIIEEEMWNAPADQRRLYYYGGPNPTLDRYAVIMTADALVDATIQEGTTGMETITPGFQMLLPRFLSPDKPVYGTGNLLAHRARGLVAEDDEVTQITMGLFADAFSSFGFLGTAIIPCLVLLALMFAYQRTIGCSLRRNPYALAFSLTAPWLFSEGTICSAIVAVLQGTLVIVVTFSVCGFLTAILVPKTAARVAAAATAG